MDIHGGHNGALRRACSAGRCDHSSKDFNDNANCNAPFRFRSAVVSCSPTLRPPGQRSPEKTAPTGGRGVRCVERSAAIFACQPCSAVAVLPTVVFWRVSIVGKLWLLPPVQRAQRARNDEALYNALMYSEKVHGRTITIF